MFAAGDGHEPGDVCDYGFGGVANRVQQAIQRTTEWEDGGGKQCCEPITGILRGAAGNHDRDP